MGDFTARPRLEGLPEFESRWRSDQFRQQTPELFECQEKLRRRSFRGSRNVNVLPPFGSQTTCTLPPWASRMERVIASPRPVPEVVRERALLTV